MKHLHGCFYTEVIDSINIFNLNVVKISIILKNVNKLTYNFKLKIIIPLKVKTRLDLSEPFMQISFHLHFFLLNLPHTQNRSA